MLRLPQQNIRNSHYCRKVDDDDRDMEGPIYDQFIAKHQTDTKYNKQLLRYLREKSSLHGVINFQSWLSLSTTPHLVQLTNNSTSLRCRFWVLSYLSYSPDLTLYIRSPLKGEELKGNIFVQMKRSQKLWIIGRTRDRKDFFNKGIQKVLRDGVGLWTCLLYTSRCV